MKENKKLEIKIKDYEESLNKIKQNMNEKKKWEENKPKKFKKW